MDLTKAYDHIKLDYLFDKLLQRLPGVFVRFLLHTYLFQKCFVRWGKVKSKDFGVSNGLRQGAVASPTFFNVYLDDLFKILRESNTGCQIDNQYQGIIGYADDLALLAPSREGLQHMVNMVKDYCEQHGITISTDIDTEKSKTKCLVFNIKQVVLNLQLYNVDLPFVKKWKHLGHTITNEESSTHDIMVSRAEFISNIHSLYQEVGQIYPYIFIKLVQTYFCCFYGSPLWDLNSKEAFSFYSTWNVMIRNAFNLPFATHRYILKELSAYKHLQRNLYNRFKNFCLSVERANRPEILHLYNIQKYDCRSSFGRNYRNIVFRPKDIDIPYNVPMDCQWRVELTRGLVDIMNKRSSVDLSNAEVQDMLNYVCCT